MARNEIAIGEREAVRAEDETPRLGWRNLWYVFKDHLVGKSLDSAEYRANGTIYFGKDIYPSERQCIEAAKAHLRLRTTTEPKALKCEFVEWLGAFEVSE